MFLLYLHLQASLFAFARVGWGVRGKGVSPCFPTPVVNYCCLLLGARLVVETWVVFCPDPAQNFRPSFFSLGLEMRLSYAMVVKLLHNCGSFQQSLLLFISLPDICFEQMWDFWAQCHFLPPSQETRSFYFHTSLVTLNLYLYHGRLFPITPVFSTDSQVFCSFLKCNGISSEPQMLRGLAAPAQQP